MAGQMLAWLVNRATEFTHKVALLHSKERTKFLLGKNCTTI